MEGNPEENDVPEFLPPFANAENKGLHKLVQDLERRQEDQNLSLEDNSERINIVQEHLKNVQQELNFTEARVGAKKKEIETEEHLQKLSHRAAGRIKSERTKLNQEQQDLEEKINGLQIQLYKSNEKMDQFKLVMNWNQDEMDQWAQAERQKEGDNVTLEKYKHQDDAVIKDLNLHIERLTKNVVRKREELEREVTETQAAQIQLDKTAEDFRNLHKERQDLLQQWDEAVEAMRRRDQAIEVANERFKDRKAMLGQKQNELDAQSTFLEQEKVNNKELEARIETLDRGVAKVRETCGEEQQRTLEVTDEVDIIQNTLRKAANDLAQKSSENDHSKRELEVLRSKVDAARKQFAVTRRKLESEMNQLDNLELRDGELVAMCAAEQRHLDEAQKEVVDLKAQQFKEGQKLFTERHRERELISEIAGAHSQNKNLKAKIAQLDDQVQKQQELLYNIEFQIVLMERKVSRAQGERSDAETKELNEQIEKLTCELEGVNAEHALLLSQLKKAEDDLTQARRKNTKLTTDKAIVEDAIDQLSLETSMAQRCIKAAVDEKENKMVEHDVLKLQLKRLKDILALRADEVYSLENKQAQLKLSMEERRQEINVHRDALKVELKNAREDIHRVTLELKERSIRADKLKQKFQTLSTKGQSILDDEPKSQAYYLIQAAQEREELQRSGDNLDAKIKKAEKEVRALETTLAKLIDVNVEYGNSMRKVSGETSVTQRLELRDKLDRAYDKLKFKRAEEMNIEADIHQAEARLRNLVKEGQGHQTAVTELSKREAEAERQLQEQKEKQNRAKKRVNKLRSEIRVKQGTTEETPEERDVAVAEVRDCNRAILSDLRTIALEHPQLGIAEKLEAVGIKLPSSVTATPHSSRSSSRAHSPRPSSARSVRSGTGSVRSRPQTGASQGASVTNIELGVS
ncbi:hypothetical protein BSKO_01909 [Bryopsis sp. KO-2023]|nr:hypothetical protein BSKO_01909 [Bryopsis sp. KO-2023]